MKVLKIEANNGFFLRNDGEYCKITSISSDDIIQILEWILEVDDIEMDNYDSQEVSLKNPAEAIIYSELYKRFISTLMNKTKIIDEVKLEFKDAYEKYAAK